MNEKSDRFWQIVFRSWLNRKKRSVFNHKGFKVCLALDKNSEAYDVVILLPSDEDVMELTIASPNLRKARMAVKEWIDRQYFRRERNQN